MCIFVQSRLDLNIIIIYRFYILLRVYHLWLASALIKTKPPPWVFQPFKHIYSPVCSDCNKNLKFWAWVYICMQKSKYLTLSGLSGPQWWLSKQPFSVSKNNPFKTVLGAVASLGAWCYGNIKNAYLAKPKPPLSNLDHNMNQLVPSYKSVFKTHKTEYITVNVWTKDSKEALKGCFFLAWCYNKWQFSHFQYKTTLGLNEIDYQHESVKKTHYSNSRTTESKLIKWFLYKIWNTKFLRRMLNGAAIAD